eukprot:Lithocolla_globosa_v1_NODE_170_length_5489_cov_5.804196.p3 type:complete len:120 gc:universal NODE_170_length_5489_cov_5.804196:3538-3897(+)
MIRKRSVESGMSARPAKSSTIRSPQNTIAKGLCISGGEMVEKKLYAPRRKVMEKLSILMRNLTKGPARSLPPVAFAEETSAFTSSDVSCPKPPPAAKCLAAWCKSAAFARPPVRTAAAL